MKILDRYILTTYLKSFFSVFIIIMLIFILQTLWLYINELAGKDLEITIILKFLLYFTPKLIPLVLPLTILLSSIMVFGSFAENYEFAAMKSTGISLQRAMKSLSIFIVGVGIVTFFFANNVIPWAEINSFNLRTNIAKLKPAAFIAEGQFNQLDEGFNIKVEKKSGETGQFLEKVVIHKRNNSFDIQHKTIISETGEFFYKKNSQVLQLILHNGNYYEDLPTSSTKSNGYKPFAKSSFDKYIINIDLSKINNVNMDEKSKTDKYNMLDLPGLNKAIDSLIKSNQIEHEAASKNLIDNFSINYSSFNSAKTPEKNTAIKTNLLDVFEIDRKIQLVDMAIKSISNTKQILDYRNIISKQNRIVFNKHVITYHQKLALSFACIILFFVGAPLGAIIRKGGMGLPMIIAILLFLSYHFIGMFATNSAKNGEFNPTLASWFSTIIMLPLGIYLTRRATADRSVFEIGNFMEPIKKVLRIKKKENLDAFLKTYNKEGLVNVINNYDSLGYDKTICITALDILLKKGETISSIKELGVQINSNYESTHNANLNYKSHSKFALWLYTISGVLLGLFFVFKSKKLEPLESASIQLSVLFLILYIIYYTKTLLNIVSFYKTLLKEPKKPNFIILILALPLFIITFPFINIKMKEHAKQNCLDSLK